MLKVTRIAAGRYGVMLANGAKWEFVQNEGRRWVAYDTNDSSSAWDGLRTKGEVVAALNRLNEKLVQAA